MTKICYNCLNKQINNHLSPAWPFFCEMKRNGCHWRSLKLPIQVLKICLWPGWTRLQFGILIELTYHFYRNQTCIQWLKVCISTFFNSFIHKNDSFVRLNRMGNTYFQAPLNFGMIWHAMKRGLKTSKFQITRFS